MSRAVDFTGYLTILSEISMQLALIFGLLQVYSDISLYRNWRGTFTLHIRSATGILAKIEKELMLWIFFFDLINLGCRFCAVVFKYKTYFVQQLKCS